MTRMGASVSVVALSSSRVVGRNVSARLRAGIRGGRLSVLPLTVTLADSVRVPDMGGNHGR